MTPFYYTHPNIAPATTESILVEINARAVPLLISSLERYKYRQHWASDVDYQNGVLQLNAIQEALLTGTTQIVEAIDRLYRLWDSSINGTQYTVTPAEEPPPAPPPDPTRPTITPAIPTAPPATSAVAPGLRARLERLIALQDNFNNGRVYASDLQNPLESALTNTTSMRQQLLNAQGIINAGWFGIGGQPAKLSDIVNALRIGSTTDQGLINDTLQEILDAGSNTAGIFNAVRGLLGDTVSGVTEGGILATLIASSIASAAISGMTAAQLDRIIAALDGGALIRPDDNILQALRGDTMADGDRNVVRQIEQVRQVSEITQAGLFDIGDVQIAILTAIRDALRSASPDEALIAVVQQIRQSLAALPNAEIAPLIDEVEALLTDIRVQTS